MTLRYEWDKRAQRNGLQSVMSTRWSEQTSVDATRKLKLDILNSLGKTNGIHLLELGPGIGRFTKTLRHTGAHVTAVDHSYNMITRAKRKTSCIPFINASADHLPLSDAFFDTSLAVTVLQHIVDPLIFEQAIQELKRVTSKKIIICDELRSIQSEQVSPFTMLRTLDQFTALMDGWRLVSTKKHLCITDLYTIMIWQKE